ncbi:protein AAR2 homolog isoform X2 [Apostichopus japonicus]
MASMSQETAQKLFEEGAVLLFLDVPPGTEFGIDYTTWNTGEKFKGVKMIPAGIHFVHYSAVSLTQGDKAPRTGFFHCFGSREVLVKRWDPSLEDIRDEEVTSEEIEEKRNTLKELDPFLGVYPYDNFKKWVSLTNEITKDLVQKISPLCGKIASAAQLVPDDASRTTSDRAKLKERDEGSRSAEQNLPRMHSKPGTALRFSEIPMQSYPEGASPAEITRHSMDRSFTLSSLLAAHYDKEPQRILGEIQVAFICFLIGQVYDAFEQWKQLVALLCSCETAISEYGPLYSAFIQMMHFQLKEIPADFFVDIVSRDNFLTSTLRTFFQNIRSSEADEPLKEKCRRFQQNLTKKYRWDFESEPDDEAPIIVEL